MALRPSCTTLYPLFSHATYHFMHALTVLVEEDGAGDDEGDDGERDDGAQERGRYLLPRGRSTPSNRKEHKEV